MVIASGRDVLTVGLPASPFSRTSNRFSEDPDIRPDPARALGLAGATDPK
jgi:hypothetical protein